MVVDGSPMKCCGYCGRENDDAALRCQGCGTEFVQGRVAGEDVQRELGPTERLEKIATLDNEIQAGLVDAILSDRKIPHIMQTYRDSAYDGIFQTQKGWGVLLAPPAFGAEIRAVVEEVKRQSSRQNPEDDKR
jgi:hypothetical protein